MSSLRLFDFEALPVFVFLNDLYDDMLIWYLIDLKVF